MTILCPARPPVKPGLKPRTRPARPFGEGIAPDDAPDWADSPDPADPIWDFWAAESAAMDALERGLIPPDLARAIARTSLVGHDA